MDRRSWLWRKRSSDKSPGESESTGSSHSERYSDDQEALRASPNHAQSPDISSNVGDNEVGESNKKEDEVHQTVKNLTAKLSAALLNINVKEDLVKQHSKVAEEAVLGWEKAEKEVAFLKQKLEVTSRKNSALEDKISHLDGALKECVRQFRQSREEQEQRIHDALIKKTSDWESVKLELENQLAVLKEQLEDAKAEPPPTIIDNLQSKIEATKKENAVLKANIVALSEELKVRTLERELSTQTAETASKQQLESIRKVAKLEAECRRLKAAARKALLPNDHKTIPFCVESLTDSQSDSGDQLLSIDNEPSCSDSWASALIAELDQFKNEKPGTNNLTNSIDIMLMDDFLEMERLVALPESDHGSSSIRLEADSSKAITRATSSKVELQIMNQERAELEVKVNKIEIEKAKVEIALEETRNQLETSHIQLAVAEGKVVELQKELDMANQLKQAATSEAVSLETQLESAWLENGKLQDKVAILERKVEESTFSSELKIKLEFLEETREALQSQLQTSYLEVEKLEEKVGLLESRVEEEQTLSAEFATKVEAAEATREAMRSQLLTTNLEVRKLQKKIGVLEQRIEEERSQWTEFAAKLESVGEERNLLEIQLESACSEVGKLHDKVGLLERKVDEERALSAQFASKCQNLMDDLQSARSEVGTLHDKVGLLEEKVDEERALSARFAAKCQNLEDELSKKRQEAEVRYISISNGQVKIKQENELAMAAGKLAECQKTIASLGRQLNSLKTLDDFMLETENNLLCSNYS